MSLRVPWSLYDPELDEIYYLPVNPYDDAGSHAINKQVAFETASGFYQDSLGADHVGTIASIGQPDLELFNYTGKTYQQTDHEALESWVAKDYPVHLTDDLGRSWVVLLENFSVRRLRTTKRTPFKHEYSLTGFIIQELS